MGFGKANVQAENACPKVLTKWAFLVYFSAQSNDEDSIIFPKGKASQGG